MFFKYDRYVIKATKLRIYNSIVRSIMTYGTVIWVINKSLNKIRSTEMDFMRKICRFRWMDRIINVEARAGIDVKRTPLMIR